MKSFISIKLMSISVAFAADQQAYDSDDGIHHPNSTKIAYSVQQKAVRDSGSSCPNAQQLSEAYDALAKKHGTLVYKYEQEKKASKE